MSNRAKWGLKPDGGRAKGWWEMGVQVSPPSYRVNPKDLPLHVRRPKLAQGLVAGLMVALCLIMPLMLLVGLLR